MKNLLFIGLTILSLIPLQTNAQEENTLKIRPTGRILLDGGLYHSDNQDFADGIAMPDFRIGTKVCYGKFKAKIDLGYAYGKVCLKDIYVQRELTSHSLLRVGNFVHQFGLQSSTSSSMKVSMEEPTSNEAFFNSRLIGAMYIYDKNSFFATASLHAECAALKKRTNELGKMGYGAMSRMVFRPLRKDGALFQIGISGAYEMPRYNENKELSHNSFALGANFPTRIARVRALDALVKDAKYLFKFSPEMVAAYGPVALETQYYYLQVNRENDFQHYNASGAYGLLRGLIIGGNYKHSHCACGIATPSAGSLECVLGYNYTDMSDATAEIYGGRLNDVSFTVNYYLNKYMIWKLRYSYTRTTNRRGFENQTLNALQTRFQIIF